jgi:isoaspartyl peptidase/L-asparaginase-like protein (Ntn-hydrolase superfamily)
MFKSGTWSMIVHGGAGKSSRNEKERREGVLWALAQGTSILKEGGSAIDAVEQSIKFMEKSGIFNAGYGSVLNAAGIVEMDASIMDGKTLDIGAVACLKHVAHPISVSRLLLKEKPILLVGPEADEFARKKRVEPWKERAANPQNESIETVGAVVRDKAGNMAAGLSTGGIKGTMPGRVGDTPLPGCGFYADNERGGVCLSGQGEKISRVTFAAEVMQHMKSMSIDDAIKCAFLRLKRVKGTAGCIGIDSKGNIAWHHNTVSFSVALQTSGDPSPMVYFKKN